MYKVQSKFFGEIVVEDDKVITLVESIIGFEKLKKFVLIPHNKDNMFKWFQSLEDPEVCFLVVEPVSFMFNYSLEIPDELAERLEIKSPEDVVIYSIVVIPEDPAKISANLCGPIVINALNRLGAQVISNNPEHKVKHYIIEELKKNTERLVSNLKSMVSAGQKIAEEFNNSISNQPEPAKNNANGVVD